MATTTINKMLEPFITRYLAGELDGVGLRKNLKILIEEQQQSSQNQITFSNLINKFVSSCNDLIAFPDVRDTINKHRICGITILDCLLDVNDEIKPERKLEIANSVFKLLENDKPPLATNLHVLRAGAVSIGHFARIASQAEIDYLQSNIFEVSLNHLRVNNSESYRFMGAVVITQLALNSPSLVFGRRKPLFDFIWDVVSDRNSLVRGAASEALEASLQLVFQREAINQYLDLAIKQIDAGFISNKSEKVLGSLIILQIILDSGVFMLNNNQSAFNSNSNTYIKELIWRVFLRKDDRDPEIRQKVIGLLPSLASTFTNAFVSTNKHTDKSNYLLYAITYLLDVINSKKEKVLGFTYLGKLFVVMAHHLRTSNMIIEIFKCIRDNGFQDNFTVAALQCLGMLVNVSIPMRSQIDFKTVELMFRGGLTPELVDCLKIVIRCVPNIRQTVKVQLRNHIASILLRHSVMIDGARQRNSVRMAVGFSNYLSGSGSNTNLSGNYNNNSNSNGINTGSNVKELTAPSKTSIWNTNIFGTITSAAMPSTPTSTSLQAKSSIRPEDEIIFALQVLTSVDFFPKQSKERMAASPFIGFNNTTRPSFNDFAETTSPSSINYDEDQGLHLLAIVRDAVVRYLDDFNPDIRLAAACSCASVIDTVIYNIEPTTSEFVHLYQILDRLLVMGVGDDSTEIRWKIFQSFSPSLDHLMSMTQNVHCLIEALNDESLQVRAAATTVLARVAPFDTLHVMPIVRLNIKRLVLQLHNASDHNTREESVHLLQALVRGCDSLIIPYAKQIMGALMSLLEDSTASITIATLSTVGELAVASPEYVKEHLESLSIHLIAALNDSSSVAKRETAVVTMGKLVSSIAMETDEPYKKYGGLFEGLVKAIQSVDESSVELRCQAIRTVGLLGCVDMKVFADSQFAGNATILDSFNHTDNDLEMKNADDQPLVNASVGPTTVGVVIFSSGDKQLTQIERYNLPVVIRKLMNVVRDPSLSTYHQIAITIAVKIIRTIGSQAADCLKFVIDGINFRLYQNDIGNNLREVLLDNLMSIILALGKSMRPFISEVNRIVVDFFDQHPQQCLDLVEATALVFSTPDFITVLVTVMPTFISAFYQEGAIDGNSYDILFNNDQMSVVGSAAEILMESNSSSMNGRGAQQYLKSSASNLNLANGKVNPTNSNKSNPPISTRSDGLVNGSHNYNKTFKILQKIVNLSDFLDDYRRQLLPLVTKILDNPQNPIKIRKEALCVTLYILPESDLQEFASRIIHPLLRVADSNDNNMQSTVITALSLLICRLGTGFIPYIIPVRRKIQIWRDYTGVNRSSKLDEYESLVNRLLKQRPLPPEPSDVSEVTIRADDRIRNRLIANKTATDPIFQFGPQALQALENAWSLTKDGRNNASDLIGWMKRLSGELIRQSPSPIIRSCVDLSKLYPQLAHDLFNSSFVCIWHELVYASGNETTANNLINGIEMALQGRQTPANIIIAILNLAEFMDMQDKRLPIDVKILAKQAQSVNMFAKCLRYREMEFNSSNLDPTSECIDALITVNNQLGLGDRASGVLQYLQNFSSIEVEPGWLEKLQRWEEARARYDEVCAKEVKKEQLSADSQTTKKSSMAENEKWLQAQLGKLRCLNALGEYEELEECSKMLKYQMKVMDDSMNISSSQRFTALLPEVQSLGARASWMLGRWDSMADFLDQNSAPSNTLAVNSTTYQTSPALLNSNSPNQFNATNTSHPSNTDDSKGVELYLHLPFYHAILAIHQQDYDKATTLIQETRLKLSSNISSLLSERYSRAYQALITSQILAEMEEVIQYRLAAEKAAMDLEALKTNASDTSFNYSKSMMTTREKINSANTELATKRSNLIRKWSSRLKWAPKEFSVYRQILTVHTLVADPLEDLEGWLGLVSMCRKEGMFSLCESILRKLGAPLVPKVAKFVSTSDPLSPANLDRSQHETEPLFAALEASDGHDSEKKPKFGTSSNFLTPQPGSNTTQSILQSSDIYKTNDRVLFSTLKFLWSRGEKALALTELTNFLESCVRPNNLANPHQTSKNSVKDATLFRVQCLLRRAEWLRELNTSNVDEILGALSEAKELGKDMYSVWHAWAVVNYDQLRKVDTGNKDVKSNSGSNNNLTFNGSGSGSGKEGSDKTPTKSSLSVAFSEVSIVVNKNSGSKKKNMILGNGKILESYTPRRGSASLLNLRSIQRAGSVVQYVVHAIEGFVKSIILGQGQPVANVLQDTLRLITLWFSYGTKAGVHEVLDRELDKISPMNWLAVIPQLIARVHIKSTEISGLLRKLLKKVAVVHPQALVCPISVALNTNDLQQRNVSTEVLNEMRKHRSQLVEEATMVSRELMRVAITPHELWYDGFEKAAQLYMDSKDINEMLTVLLELHDTMNDSPNSLTTGVNSPLFNANFHNNAIFTKAMIGFSDGIGKIGRSSLRDIAFRQSYGQALSDAMTYLESFRKSNRIIDLHQAWEIYQQIFKKIKVQIANLKYLELDHISPALMNATNLSLAVPGTYDPATTDISIKSFSPSISVIASKQRPRRMCLHGSDGNQYEFLLKGHEDLRQDERVMQLFGLINVCVDSFRSSSNAGLAIVRYSVLPLSNNSGLIGWVQNCDTINQLVKTYRESNGIKFLNLEAKLLSQKSLNYDKLTLMQKVEAFKQVCEETTGQDLSKMLWLRSKTTDVWIERRANFIKSLAVMSMVGYILGLGDRHPSNLMIERLTGKVVHIDFGDCFEITSQRAKYPEIVPFRLTRMLTNCMGAAGMEGTFRLTSERMIRVLRDNRDSVMAMLEAFVYDPLISWRLLANREREQHVDQPTQVRQSSINASQDQLLNDQSRSPLQSTSNIESTPNSSGKYPNGILSSRDGGLDDGPGNLSDVLAHSIVDDKSNVNGPPHRIVTSGMSYMVNANAGRMLDRLPSITRTPSQDGEDDFFNQDNLNTRALEVISRIQAKLTGRDFVKNYSMLNNDAAYVEELSVEQQVDRLIKEATSTENLCQLFTGWCPMW